MNRGEIYYVDIPFHTGSEMMKNRPAVIVSHNALNHTAPVVTVVYTSASIERAPSPGHVMIHSTPKPSLALCNQVYTVDRTRIGTYLGTVTEEEMHAIDDVLRLSLGLRGGEDEEAAQAPVVTVVQNTPEYAALENELAVYRALYAQLLDRVIGKI